MTFTFLPVSRALCAAFAAAAFSVGAVGNALAVNAKDWPRMLPGKPFTGSKYKEKNRYPVCVQRLGARIADMHGYHSDTIMRRATALAELYDPVAIMAISIASYESGVDFDLMVMKALIESRMGESDQPDLGGAARGLFHFMPATWLTLFSWFGAEFQGGLYADAARQIKFDENKNPFTHDSALTEKILALRSDPYVAAFIKAKSVRLDERPLLKTVLGREPTYTDYYAAHFLGLEQAKTFFRALRRQPGIAAADIFVRESEDPNNHSLFYQDDRKLTVQQVYNRLGRKVGETLKRLDREIAAELRNNKCLTPLVPVLPSHQTITFLPPAEPVPDGPKPQPPKEERDPDEDVHPAPAPREEEDTAKADPPAPSQFYLP